MEWVVLDVMVTSTNNPFGGYHRKKDRMTQLKKSKLIDNFIVLLGQVILVILRYLYPASDWLCS